MTFQRDPDHSRVYVERPWSTSDPAGKFNLLSYLVVFRLPGEAVPVVKGISVKVGDHGAALSAEVNGKLLSLQIPN